MKSKDPNLKSEQTTKASGLLRFFDSTKIYILINFLNVVFGHAKITNTSLQKNNLNFPDTSTILNDLKHTVGYLRNDHYLKMYGRKLLKKQKKWDLEPLKPDRIRTCNKRYENTSTKTEFYPEEKDKLKIIWNEMIDEIPINVG